MANENRLDAIDRNALLAEYDRVHIGEPGKARKLIAEAPTVDAVEVVRCKNCRHYQNGYCNHFGYYDYAPAVDAEDFCSHAWRKDGDGNA
jgi:hypothetical protein